MEEQYRELGAGQAVWFVPQIYTWLIAIGPIDSLVYDDQWEYQDRSAALLAFAEWDGTGDPLGWYRHHRTGRRRPNGDASQEYIHF